LLYASAVSFVPAGAPFGLKNKKGSYTRHNRARLFDHRQISAGVDG
jgi:hypothetical protein